MTIGHHHGGHHHHGGGHFGHDHGHHGVHNHHHSMMHDSMFHNHHNRHHSTLHDRMFHHSGPRRHRFGGYYGGSGCHPDVAVYATGGGWPVASRTWVVRRPGEAVQAAPISHYVCPKCRETIPAGTPRGVHTCTKCGGEVAVYGGNRARSILLAIVGVAVLVSALPVAALTAALTENPYLLFVGIVPAAIGIGLMVYAKVHSSAPAAVPVFASPPPAAPAVPSASPAPSIGFEAQPPPPYPGPAASAPYPAAQGASIGLAQAPAYSPPPTIVVTGGDGAQTHVQQAKY